MLIAAGPGVAHLTDYTSSTAQSTISIVLAQGETLPTCTCEIRDALSAYTIVDEDDFVACDEQDPTGWPTVNLATNPIFANGFASGVATGWSTTVTGTGITYAQSTAGLFETDQAQSVAVANAALIAAPGINQWIALPTNEQAQVLTAQPYYLSAWYLVTAPTNVQVRIKLSWWTALYSGFVASTENDISVLTPGIWQYAFATASPPPGAMYVEIECDLVTTSTTNSGTLLIGSMQLERATFGAYASSAFVPPLLNGTCAYHGTANCVDGWTPNAVTGATLTVVSTPSLSGKAQQCAISNATASSTVSISQAAITISPYAVYTLNLTYQLTAALTDASMTLGIAYLAANGSTLSSPIPASIFLGPLNSWQTLSLRFGPGTGVVGPAAAVAIRVIAGIATGTTGTNSGTVVFGAVTLTADSAQRQTPNAVMTAIQGGMYPTPVCYSGGAGCYVDTGATGYAYRQSRFFGGYIRKTSFDYSTTPERMIAIDAVGYGVILQESPANIIINALSDSAAIAAACRYAANQGFLAGLDYTTYVQTIATIDSLTFNWQSTKDVITQIANLTIADAWVDNYKYLHYQPSLATQGPYGFSDVPNFGTTFPMHGWKFDNDSTQALSTKVFEGGSIESLPVAQTFYGVATTLTAALTSGTAYSSLTVTATDTPVNAGTIVTLGTGQQVTISTAAISGATTLLCTSFTANQTYALTTAVVALAFLLNGGSAIAKITGVTVNAVAVTVGYAGINTYSQGYTVLVDVNQAIATWHTAPGDSLSVVVTYTYMAPVLVRLRNGGAETIYGPIRRRIHHHHKDETVTSITTAIVRAESELLLHAKAQPIGTVLSYSPPNPVGVHLLPGMAIPITHASSGLTAALFQIQRVTIQPVGPGVILYTCDVGFYRQDLARLVYMGRQTDIATGINTQGTTITDVLSETDGWSLTDAFSFFTNNIGTWGPTTPSTWSGTAVWG